MLFWELITVAVTGLAAITEDCRKRSVSNWIPVSLVVSGLILQSVQSGWRGLGSALGGGALGFGVFLIFYILGGMGGGDVKLMAGFGTLLGPGRLWTAAWLAAVIGGLMALSFLVWMRARKKDTRGQSIPYAPAIVLGSWIAMSVRG